MRVWIVSWPFILIGAVIGMVVAVILALVFAVVLAAWVLIGVTRFVVSTVRSPHTLGPAYRPGHDREWDPHGTD